MLTIGLTGPTGAGKTTVLGILEDLGCQCVDCDALYHRLLRESPELVDELTARFGRSILDNRGILDTKALGRVVFADPDALSDLNAIAHHHVVAACLPLIRQAKAGGKRAVVLDAIALMESGLGALCDVTVAVVAPREVRLARIMERDRIDRDYAQRRMDAQKPDEYYVNLCDRVIVNDSSMTKAELTEAVKELFMSTN